MDNKRRSRKPNIELIRVTVMVSVIIHHLSFVGALPFDRMSITVNRLWNQFLIMPGHAGVDAFILITGYFMINQKSLNLAKIMKIWLTMFTYSAGMYLIVTFATGAPFYGWDFVKSLIPFLNQQWPFASTYVALIIFAPFLNILLKKFTKSQYRLFLLIACILWVGVPTLSTYEASGNYLIWLSIVYSGAAYARLYPEDFPYSSKVYMSIAGVVLVLTLASVPFFDFVGFWIPICGQYATHFSGLQHLNSVIMAMTFFLGMVKMEWNKNNTVFLNKLGIGINGLATVVFGTYLAHDNRYIRKILWTQIFDNTKIMYSPWFILITLGETILVYAIAASIEWLRQQLLEKHYMGFVTRMLEKPQAKIDSIMNVEE